jgi:hypothetical protein
VKTGAESGKNLERWDRETAPGLRYTPFRVPIDFSLFFGGIGV